MDTFFRIQKYISYWLDEVNEHSLHSPFLYDFYTKVLEPVVPTEFQEFESLRKHLLNNATSVSFHDPGAGSAGKRNNLKIKDLARTSLSSAKYSLLFYRIIQYYKPEFVVELGTSLGINTLYLSEAGYPVFTFEGAQPVIEVAKDNFIKLRKKNIKIIDGNINTTLPEFISDKKKLPFIFFDANHTYNSTVHYFNLCKEKADKDSIFIFDDIYWSKEMGRAWEMIKSDEKVIVTFDLYRCGIVFFNTDLNRQHLKLRF